jgi:hypothetical protein
MMASLVSKRLRYDSASTVYEYLAHLLRVIIDDHRHNHLHEGIKPAVRNARNGKKLKGKQSEAQQKPNHGENGVVN